MQETEPKAIVTDKGIEFHGINFQVDCTSCPFYRGEDGTQEISMGGRELVKGCSGNSDEIPLIPIPDINTKYRRGVFDPSMYTLKGDLEYELEFTGNRFARLAPCFH